MIFVCLWTVPFGSCFFLMIDDGFLRQKYLYHVRFGWFNILCLLFYRKISYTLNRHVDNQPVCFKLAFCSTLRGSINSLSLFSQNKLQTDYIHLKHIFSTLCTGLFGHLLFFVIFYTGAMIYVHLCNAPYPCHTYSSGLFEYWRLLDNKILHFHHEGNVNSYSRGLLLLFQLVCFRPLKKG